MLSFLLFLWNVVRLCVILHGELTTEAANGHEKGEPGRVREKAQECRDMAKIMSQQHRTMLQHIAETWERIAKDMESENGER